MKKLFFILTLIFVVSCFLYPVSAANEGSVTATVTAQEISLTVADGSVAYGTIVLNSTKDTTSGGVDDSQTASNIGNVAEDFNIKGAATAAWTLGATAGANTYTHKFCISTCDTSPTWTALTLNNQSLATNVTAASGTQLFDLQIGTPTTTSSYTQQTATVTVQASASS